MKIFSDSDSDGQVSDNPLFDEFFAYGSFTGGVRVAAGDTDISSISFVEVLTGPGAGGGPHVKIYDDNGDPGILLSDNATSHEFFAYEGGYDRGVFLAFGKVNNSRFTLAGGSRAIADNGLVGDPLNVSIFVPSSAGMVRDLEVSLFIQHTSNSDLDVTLTHMLSGTSVILFRDVGNNDDGLFIRLTDAAVTDIGSVADDPNDRAVAGSFNPEGTALLAAFDCAGRLG